MPNETPPVITKTLIPQDLHDREYIKPWLDKEWNGELAAEVFKKLDGSQTLLGKKRGIPAADAKDEEVNAFYEALRPQKVDEYELALGEKPDEEFVKSFRSAAFDAGVSKRSLKVMTEKLMPFFKGRAETHATEQAKIEKEYGEFVKTAMGEGWEKRQERVQTALKELAPEGAKKFIDKLNNNDLALVVTIVDSVLKKYAKEDDFSAPAGGGAGGGTDKESLVAELKTLYAKKGWKDFTDPESAKVRKRVEEILAHPLMK